MKKAFVITITSFAESLNLAKRCIDSSKKYSGPEVTIFPAITPKDQPSTIMANENLSISKFIGNRYSRFENVVSCFLSHYFLWKYCIELDEPILILEHDSVFTTKLDWNSIQFDRIINVGKPSFGNFKTQNKAGVHRLFSKRYFPGGHAYMIKPTGAKQIIEYARKNGPEPTDVFLDLNNFSWLQEYYPWPIEVQETFSTVQLETGSKAKHAYGEKYRCVEIN